MVLISVEGDILRANKIASTTGKRYILIEDLIGNEKFALSISKEKMYALNARINVIEKEGFIVVVLYYASVYEYNGCAHWPGIKYPDLVFYEGFKRDGIHFDAYNYKELDKFMNKRANLVKKIFGYVFLVYVLGRAINGFIK